MCQDKLVKACKELKKVSFFENYDYKKIQKTTKEFYLILLQSPKESYNKCNCADTLWLALLNDPRPLTSCTHCELGENRGDYLRYLVLLIDEYNLEVEFSIQCLPTLLDSFNYVIQRVEIKNIKRETSKDSWRTFYHCIEAETNFLKEKSQFLFKTYLKYFDDTTNNEYNRDLMLCSLFDSKQFIEEEIIKRMSKEDNYKFFYRMLGILTTSGSNKSIKYLSNHLKTHKLELKETELILRAIYEIKSNKRIDEPIWTSFKNFLKDSKLDSLVKANYFEELYLNNDRK
ncbi:MAG: hypothetical protein JNK69_11965 [Saprospiraceae bacterium]|nr:hypothetical protein [Saprospiraceae bacterium]MCC6841487.1 hypothetical protein [Saprospiraceae bacterium]